MWREVSDEEKQELVEEWEAEKAEYGVSLKAYHQSPEYQTYLREKKNVTAERDEPSNSHSKSHSSSSSAKNSGGGNSGGNSVGNSGGDFPKVALIPAADDDDDLSDGFSEKHLAAARYTRNHLLINEIFSDAMVPDARSVVTSARMNILKRQVTSLSMHQEKLEKELQQLEEKHESKKRKFLDAAEKFNDDYSNQCDFRVTKEQCEEFYKKHCETIKQQLASKGKLTAGAPPAVGAGSATSTSAPTPTTNASTPTSNSGTTTTIGTDCAGDANAGESPAPNVSDVSTTPTAAPAVDTQTTSATAAESTGSPAVPVAQPLSASAQAPKS